MAKRKANTSEKTIQPEIDRIGQTVWGRLSHRKPSMFDRRWIDDRIMAWAMADESIKVQMFRFVDVLPMLRDYESINRHLHEYFEDVQQYLPWAARLALNVTDGNHILGRALAVNARSNARRMAERFIAGSNIEEVTQTVLKIRDAGFAFTLDQLGEAVLSDQEADAYQQTYLDLLENLPASLNSLPESLQVDANHLGPLPRVNLSLKLSALDAHFNPADPKGTTDRVLNRLRPILRSAMQQGAFVNIDMEQFYFKDLTYQIFCEVLMEKEFRQFADVGIVCQAYLKSAEDDLKSLLKWVKKRKTSVTLRLVKGAYWDYETVVAGLRSWPVPVFEQKWESDANFEKLTTLLLKNYELFAPAFGSHNLRSLSFAIATAEQMKVPRQAYELQMLYGMGTEQAQVFSELGHRVRIYTPFGERIPGMAYLVRRLLENTSNDSFLRHSYQEDVCIEQMLKKPAACKEKSKESSDSNEKKTMNTTSTETEIFPFVNEPLTDFSRKENREAMQQALEQVRDQFGEEYPVMISGKSYETRQQLTSRCPFDSDIIVGRTSSATSELVEEAIDSARRALIDWSGIDADHRAEYLDLVASEMQSRRFELAAWMVYESAKPWKEADGDVAEAIDFCRYYATQMRMMEQSFNTDLPGEENEYFYRPRGVSVVIAPWNFPLAILTGMTVASIVTGNTVVMKPAEQSPVIAAKLMEIFRSIGLPDGVVNYLPGIGEEIGPDLVASPDVDLIAFTGSREVGLEINQRAAETGSAHHGVKRVIAEMGGKNAIIIDEDADLDEAVQGVIESAFSFSGQKCSACSRLIVVEKIYEQFLNRLQPAVESLQIGPADHPGTQLSAVIDSESSSRIAEYIDIGKDENELLFAGELDSKQKKQQTYIAPHLFTDVEAEDQIAREEIFGPVLAVIKAKDFAEAIKFANSTDYALTGGVYSRSPVNLKKARKDFLVGNLYLNRPCTGALVNRQPFGGFRMSGIGSKSGGSDYLHQFLIPINVTENTMRRGFAPEEE